MKKIVSTVLITGGVIVAGSCLVAPVHAQTAEVPQEIKDSVSSAKASVQAISGISTVALAVGLSPLGAMLSLRFLNMILSRV